MFFLLAHIVFASSFTLLIKWAQQRGRENVLAIGAINYIVAAVVMIPVFLTQNPAPVSTEAIFTGASMGLTYFTAYFFVIFAIQRVGAASATVVSVLSILMPIGCAAIFFDTRPTAWQSCGIGLALGSLLLIGGSKNRMPAASVAGGMHDATEDGDDTSVRWVVPVVLMAFFLLCGCNRMAQEAFKFLSQSNQRPAFLMTAFLVAATPSLIVLIWQRRWPSRGEWVIGISMGLANVLQTFFVLRALEHLAGYLVFTLASGGAILLTTLVATGWMGERLNRRTQVGISLAVVALVLLRWLPG